MRPFSTILFALLCSVAAVRADLVLEQQSSDTNGTRTATIKLHGDKMRLDQPEEHFSVIFDLGTRDSYTLITTNQTYLKRFGSEIKWEIQEEKKYTSGTNEMDKPPARPVDTGKSETVDGYQAKVLVWSGAHGATQTLWVATDFPNFEAIRAELYKLDKFNDSGPHRNAQPPLSLLPGMVVKSENVMKGVTVTNILLSAKVEPLEDSLFNVPADYKPYKRTEDKKP